MPDDIFLTKTELARVRGVDRRNKLLEAFEPAAFLLTGSKKIPLFRASRSRFLIERFSAAGLKLPQSEPIQPEAKP